VTNEVQGEGGANPFYPVIEKMVVDEITRLDKQQITPKTSTVQRSPLAEPSSVTAPSGLSFGKGTSSRSWKRWR
jgi:hypothetical protein